MHIDEVKALARQAHADPRRLEELMAAALGGEGRVARDAAWALTHLPAADNSHLDSHRDALVQQALVTTDTSVRRLTLALLARLEWPLEQVRTDLLDFALQHLADPGEADGVRALCIKLAYAQCSHYAELREELRQCLLMLDSALLRPGVKHTRNKTLKLL